MREVVSRPLRLTIRMRVLHKLAKYGCLSVPVHTLFRRGWGAMDSGDAQSWVDVVDTLSVGDSSDSPRPTVVARSGRWWRAARRLAADTALL